MQFSLGNWTKVAIIALMGGGVVLSASSRAAVQSSHRAPSRLSGSGCSVICFEDVNYNSKCNQLTSINDFQAIVGAYTVCGNNQYSSFFATTPQATGTPTGLPSYPPSDFTSESYPGSNGTYDILLQGSDNGRANGNNTTMVGSWQPGGILCTAITCGAWVLNGAWTSLTDPHQGNGSCAVTQLLAINDAHVAVGFYDKNSGLDSCTSQAFEAYPDPNNSGQYIYKDLTPSPPPSGTLISSQATSINQLDDVVGTVTWQSGSQFYTSGWLYSDLAYFNQICYPSCSAPNTYALGVNINDDVVGYYTSGSATIGFFTQNPENSTPNLVPINDTNNNSNYTIVRSLNTNCVFAGTTEGNGGVLHGFVAYAAKHCSYNGKP